MHYDSAARRNRPSPSPARLAQAQVEPAHPVPGEARCGAAIGDESTGATQPVVRPARIGNSCIRFAHARRVARQPAEGVIALGEEQYSWANVWKHPDKV